MRTVTAGDTTISAVGAGDVSLPTAAARNIDKGEVERALAMAIELGITFVDVSADADSEALVGRIVRKREVSVMTRVNLVEDRPDRILREILADRLPPAHVVSSVEASLRASKLDVLPFVQLQLRASWRQSRDWSELEETCARLVREGKVLRWTAIAVEDVGARALDPDEPAPPSALEVDWLCAIAMPLSMCERKAPRPAKLILARRPLAGGALAGSLGPGAKLAVRDDRLDVDEAMLIRYAVMAARLAAFVRTTPPSARACVESRTWLDAMERPELVECDTIAELALRWCMDQGALALPRLHRVAHVAEAIAAASLPPLTYDPVA